MLQEDTILSHENQIKELENKVRFYEQLVSQLPHHFTYKNPQSLFESFFKSTSF